MINVLSFFFSLSGATAAAVDDYPACAFLAFGSTRVYSSLPLQ